MNDLRIGKQIKKARIESKMSQSVFGEKLGVTWEMISRYENGRSSAKKHLEQISAILDKPISYFYGLYEENTNSNQSNNTLRQPQYGYSSQQSQSNNNIPLVERVTQETKSQIDSQTRIFYTVPNWVIEKFGGLFGLRLSHVESKSIDFNKDDIAVLSTTRSPKSDEYALYEDATGNLTIEPARSSATNLIATLIYIERRYID